MTGWFGGRDRQRTKPPTQRKSRSKDREKDYERVKEKGKEKGDYERVKEKGKEKGDYERIKEREKELERIHRRSRELMMRYIQCDEIRWEQFWRRCRLGEFYMAFRGENSI